MPMATEKAITWMNSTVNGRPVIPRTGYIVEVNSLWYNALAFYCRSWFVKVAMTFWQTNWMRRRK